MKKILSFKKKKYFFFMDIMTAILGYVPRDFLQSQKKKKIKKKEEIPVSSHALCMYFELLPFSFLFLLGYVL